MFFLWDRTSSKSTNTHNMVPCGMESLTKLQIRLCIFENLVQGFETLYIHVDCPIHWYALWKIIHTFSSISILESIKWLFESKILMVSSQTVPLVIILYSGMSGWVLKSPAIIHCESSENLTISSITQAPWKMKKYALNYWYSPFEKWQRLWVFS